MSIPGNAHPCIVYSIYMTMYAFCSLFSFDFCMPEDTEDTKDRDPPENLGQVRRAGNASVIWEFVNEKSRYTYPITEWYASTFL